MGEYQKESAFKDGDDVILNKILLNVLYLDGNFHWVSEKEKSMFIAETANMVSKLNRGKLPIWWADKNGGKSLKFKLKTKIRRWLFDLEEHPTPGY